MPKPPTPKDEQLIDNIHQTFERAAGEVPDGMSAMAYCVQQALAADQVTTSEILSLLTGKRQFSPDEIHKRWLAITVPASSQTFSVCRAMSSYLAINGHDKPAIAAILPQTNSIGRQFGLLPSGAFDKSDSSTVDGTSQPMNDLVALRLMSTDPADWFNLDMRGRLDFSDHAKSLLRPAYDKRIGCSILHRTVMVDGQETNMYDAFWTALTGQFVENQLALPDIPWSD